MTNRVRTGLILVALLQFIPIIVLPPDLLLSIPLWGWIVVVALFGLLGISLLRRRIWARTATIFVQGFNIIVRLLVMVRQAVDGTEVGDPINAVLLGTFVASMILSTIILYYVDLPEVQMVMQ